VPFSFRKRGKAEPTAVPTEARPPTAPHGGGRRIPFEGLTEEWRLVGSMDATGRLSDVLNRREPVEITDMRWAPADGSAELGDAPGLRSIDPYDLIIVLAGEATLPPLSDEEKSAYKVHKIEYDVALEVPPYRVIGTIYLYPGSEPERLLDRSTEMFIPVTDATALLGERRVNDPEIDTILVNRFYLRGVSQIDKRTGERPRTLPGAPLGGTTWTDRSR
jgi:hypothetical protein